MQAGALCTATSMAAMISSLMMRHDTSEVCSGLTGLADYLVSCRHAAANADPSRHAATAVRKSADICRLAPSVRQLNARSARMLNHQASKNLSC